MDHTVASWPAPCFYSCPHQLSHPSVIRPNFLEITWLLAISVWSPFVNFISPELRINPKLESSSQTLAVSGLWAHLMSPCSLAVSLCLLSALQTVQTHFCFEDWAHAASLNGLFFQKLLPTTYLKDNAICFLQTVKIIWLLSITYTHIHTSKYASINSQSLGTIFFFLIHCIRKNLAHRKWWVCIYWMSE